MRTADIRQSWLDFFAARDHTIVPSASLISDDPSIMFTIAGMVPFIPYLNGTVPAPYKRAADCQKCIRTNDIEEVGKTARHGTFFQMLGNWSFGDYFKAGAIEYAWEFLTSSEADGGLGLPEDKLWVTVYEDDDEARQLWKKIAGLPEHRIQGLGKEDNYWSTGQPGPAGPCSEIYYDRGPAYGADGGPAVDDTRFVEIWNLVFMQYAISDVKSKTEFKIVGELPKKNIDTGMGLERVAFIKQGVDNMYEIDQVRPVLDRVVELSGRPYDKVHEDDVRMRIIADHVRSALMLIGDGVSPSNEGRGYILRRIIRRTVRAMRLLGVGEATLPELLPISRDAMQQSYPELATDFGRISDIAYAEEDTFLKTLSSGTTILDTAVADTKSQGKSALSGSTAFLLHDTYGFPIDLTLEVAEESGLKVDRKAFDALMTEQRDRAKADAKAKRHGNVDLAVYAPLRKLGETVFTGYTDLETPSKVIGLLQDGQPTNVLTNGQIGEVCLAETSLYAESGGQDADQGIIYGPGYELEVLDVQKPVPGLVIHRVKVSHGQVAIGDEATSKVDAKYRRGATQAHSATHLVHAALREILGSSAHQAGSYNKAGYMRLDFSWSQALSSETRSEIEDRANTAIRENLEVVTRQLPLTEAKELGAMALFGEKYGNVVRMVDIGGPWSRELCGGTHVASSGDIGLINLVGESSISSSSRRVEALVGPQALDAFATERALVSQLSQELKVPRSGLAERVSSLVSNLKDAERQIEQFKTQALEVRVPALLASAAAIDHQGKTVSLIVQSLGGVDRADDVRTLALKTRERAGSDPAIIALIGEVGGNPSIVVATNAAARDLGFKAGALLSIGAKQLGGGGGGKPDLAQGGGKDATQIDAALEAISRAARA